MKKEVAVIAWIPLQIVAYILTRFVELMIQKTLISENQWYCIRPPALSFLNVLENVAMIGVFVVVVVGEIILIRHGYGSRKFWKHAVIWYAVYVVPIVGMALWKGAIFNVLGDPVVISFTVATCLYPVMALLGLMLVMTISRRMKKQMR